MIVRNLIQIFDRIWRKNVYSLHSVYNNGSACILFITAELARGRALSAYVTKQASICIFFPTQYKITRACKDDRNKECGTYHMQICMHTYLFKATYIYIYCIHIHIGVVPDFNVRYYCILRFVFIFYIQPKM